MWDCKNNVLINEKKMLQAYTTATQTIVRAQEAEEAIIDTTKIDKKIDPLDYSRSSS